MFAAIRRLRCRRRGHHGSDICKIVEHPYARLVEHTHRCKDCGTYTLAQLRKYAPLPEIPPTIMGMSIEAQQEYLQ